MCINFDIEYYFDKQEALEKIMMRYFDKPYRTDREKKEIRRINRQIDAISEQIRDILK